MKKNTHSIQRVFLEIDTTSMTVANSIKNSLAMFLENELVPVLEKQFNSIENIDNQIVQIEKLEVSVESNNGKYGFSFSNSETKNNIKNQIGKEIQKALNELQKSTNIEGEKGSKIHGVSAEEKDLRTLLYFIENGSLPWWVSKADEIDFFIKINPDQFKKDIFRIPFYKLIQRKEVQNRIINQFSNQEIAFLNSAILDSETSQKALSKNILFQILHQKTNSFKVLFWQLIFNFWVEKKPISLIAFYYKEQSQFLSNKVSFELFIQNIKTFLPLDFTDKELIQIKTDYLVSEKEKLNLKSKTNTKKEEKSISESTIENFSNKDKSIVKNDEEHEIHNSKWCYVQNAGLIILHPFLKEMLKSCHLIDDKNSISNKELAAHILHYVATKKENDYEHAMLFEKFLCGIPLKQSIKREVTIDDIYKQQIEEMLDSAVHHWSALKNTSVDVLRTEFLQREGKLDWSESNPKLTIERKTQDLLLEKIPWNINIIKIPWMEKLIYTQW